MAFSRKQRNAIPVIAKQIAAINRRKPDYSGYFGTPEGIRTPDARLRSSPQFANRFVTKHKETQAFTGFWRVLFLTIPKGFTAKITSFFGL